MSKNIANAVIFLLVICIAFFMLYDYVTSQATAERRGDYLNTWKEAPPPMDGGNVSKSKENEIQLDFQDPLPCETALARLDLAMIEMEKRKNTYLIIIARLGSVEKKRGITKTRLKLLKEGYLSRFPKVKSITAEGEKIKGLSVIELYIGGELWDTLPISKNAVAFCSKEDAI